MISVLLEVSNISKYFPESASRNVGLREFSHLLLGRNRSERGSKVIDDVSFQVKRGESLALIGCNGAGKSTLLKIITGVLAPTTGQCTAFGSTAALLELGAGFDPDYSGLDNLKMNAALLGLTPKQIEESKEKIIDFADIGDALFAPVKHYSSGMVVRLGFAIVAAVRPDLLITDEVLAVGDESFQKKCIRWIENYIADGGTLLMVSHNMYQVQKLCKEAIWLENGCVRSQGDVFDVTQQYLAWHEAKDRHEVSEELVKPARGLYSIASIMVNLSASEEVVLALGQTLQINMKVKCPNERPPQILIGLVCSDGSAIYGVATDHDGHQVDIPRNGLVSIGCEFPDLAILPGYYKIKIHTLDPEGLRVHDTQERSMRVTGRTRELGVVRLAHQWTSS